MEKFLVLVGCACVFLSGCSNDFSGNTYEEKGVGEVNVVKRGIVAEMRKIKIDPESGNSGALLGAVGGGALGSMFGKGRGKLLGAAVGAAAGGTAGHMIQNRKIDGFEYIVDLDDGQTVSISQGIKPSIGIGQKVSVIYSRNGRCRVIPCNL